MLVNLAFYVIARYAVADCAAISSPYRNIVRSYQVSELDNLVHRLPLLYQSIYLFIDLTIYLSMFLCIYLSIYLSIYLCICLSISLSIYLCIYLCIYLSIYVPMYVSIYLPIYLFMYLSICPSFSQCLISLPT